MTKSRKNIIITLAIIAVVVAGLVIVNFANNKQVNSGNGLSETKTAKIEKFANKLDKHASEMTVQETIDKIKEAGYDYSVGQVEINVDGDNYIDANKTLPVDKYGTVHAESVTYIDWDPEDKNTIYVTPADEDESLREGVTRNSKYDKQSSSSHEKESSSSTSSTTESSVKKGDFYVTGKKTISASESGTYNVTAVAGDNILFVVMNDDSSDTLGNTKFSENMGVNPDQDELDMGYVKTTVVDVTEGNIVYPSGGTVKFEKVQ